MDLSFCCSSSVSGYHIATFFAHSLTLNPVVSCAKFCSDCFLPLSPLGWRVLLSWSGQAGDWLPDLWNPYISVIAWPIDRSSVELSGPVAFVVVHCHGHLPICPIWACPCAKNLSSWVQTLQNAYLWNRWMATPFKVSWTCLNLQLCNIIIICPFARYGLAHRPKTCQIRQHLGQT